MYGSSLFLFFCFFYQEREIIGILSIKFSVHHCDPNHRSLTDCLLPWWLLSDFPITSHNLNPYFPGTKTGPGLGFPPRSWNHPSSQLAPAPTPLHLQPPTYRAVERTCKVRVVICLVLWSNTLQIFLSHETIFGHFVVDHMFCIRWPFHWHFHCLKSHSVALIVI